MIPGGSPFSQLSSGGRYGRIHQVGKMSFCDKNMQKGQLNNTQKGEKVIPMKRKHTEDQTADVQVQKLDFALQSNHRPEYPRLRQEWQEQEALAAGSGSGGQLGHSSLVQRTLSGCVPPLFVTALHSNPCMCQSRHEHLHPCPGIHV